MISSSFYLSNFRVTRHRNLKPKLTVLRQQLATRNQVCSESEAEIKVIIAKNPALQYTSHDVEIIRRQARAQAENNQEAADFRPGFARSDSMRHRGLKFEPLF